MKSGISNWAATALVGEWQSGLSPDLTNLDKGIAEIKATNLAKHYTRWHVPRLGQMVQQRPDGLFRFLWWPIKQRLIDGGTDVQGSQADEVNQRLGSPGRRSVGGGSELGHLPILGKLGFMV